MPSPFDSLLGNTQTEQAPSMYTNLQTNPLFALGLGMVTSRENPIGAAGKILAQGEAAKRQAQQDKINEFLTMAKIKDAMNPSAFAGTSMDAQTANLAYQEALNQGMDDFSARKYAADKILTSKQSFGFDASGKPIARSRSPIFGIGGIGQSGGSTPAPSYGGGITTSDLPPMQGGGGFSPMDDNGETGNIPPAPSPEIAPDNVNTVDVNGMIEGAFAQIPPTLWTENPRGAQTILETQLKNIPEQEKKVIGRQRFETAIKQLEDAIAVGEQKGFLTSEKKPPLNNIVNRAFATDAGQTVSGFIGNDRATYAQDVKSVRSSIAPIMMQAYGLGATQMNTASEMDRLMAQITDGSVTVEAAKKSIERLREREGLNGGNAMSSPDMGAVEAEMRRRGLL